MGSHINSSKVTSEAYKNPDLPEIKYKNEYQQYKPGTISDSWGSTSREYVTNQIIERNCRLAIEERWAVLPEEGKKTYHNNIDEFTSDLEIKRQNLRAKLNLGEIAKEFFYHMSRGGYKLEDCRQYAYLFFLKKIEVPFLDGKEPLKMSRGKFRNWMRSLEYDIKSMIKKETDATIDTILKEKYKKGL